MKVLQQLTRRKALTSLATPRIASNRSWQRSFGVSAVAASQLPGLDASKLTVTKTSTPNEIKSPKDLVFGKTFTGMALTREPFPRNC